jgi:uncharacterized membrane protein
MSVDGSSIQKSKPVSSDCEVKVWRSYMSELVVVGYDTEAEADAARERLFAMSNQYLVEIVDAVVAHTIEKGRIKLNQMVSMWAAGATGGAFWGLFIGLLFLSPLIGVTVGAASGALGGALADYGINDKFMKSVAEILKPGQAALFIMTRKEMSDRVVNQLAEKGGRILRTNLDTTKEAALRQAFDAAHKEIAASGQTKA